MIIKVTVPELGESVIEATVGQWQKAEGDSVAVGDVLVDLETDKVDLDVSATAAGKLARILVQTGADVKIGDLLAEIDPQGEAGAVAEPESVGEIAAAASLPESPTAQLRSTENDVANATPVAQRLAAERGVDLAQLHGSGSAGRITRGDVEAFLTKSEKSPAAEARPSAPTPAPAAPTYTETGGESDSREERVRMSRRRRTIAQRLVEVQQTAAMLTTFNEIDMSAVIALRGRRKESFQEQFGVKLGFMSFFVKAAVGALKAFPRLNAEIDGDEMVIKHFYDIGMAVGVEEGLVVPVIRAADSKSFAQIEHDIAAYAIKARENNLALGDLRGGTFTITNGGVFGSLLSTPILNPPQVAILGLHAIQERPIAREGEIMVRPMMYVALSYDHRIVDGSEAVQFLVRLKKLVEDPELLMLAG